MAFTLFGNNTKSENSKYKLGFALSLLPAFSVISRMICLYVDGKFTIEESLPFHLCRAIALAFPFIMWTRNRKWMSILYFFAVAGTIQAILTPDLNFSAPHYEYYCYWLLHVVLFYLPIYCIVVYKIDIQWKHFFQAIIVSNVFLVVTGIINLILGSNYFYTSHKPPSPTLLDILGPWPLYIFVVEFMGILLFFIALIPFLLSKKYSAKYS